MSSRTTSPCVLGPICVGLAASPPALAAGGGASSAALGTVVLVLLLVGAAYLLTHVVIERLQERFLFATGFEFILVGILLGPTVGRIEAFEHLTAIAPVIALAAGWVGLLKGMDLDLGRLVEARDHVVRLGLTDALGTGTAVGLATWGLLASGWLGSWDATSSILAAGLVGCTAAAGARSGIQVVARRHGPGEGTTDFLRRSSFVADLVAILAFGSLFCVYHQGETATAEPPAPSDWVLITAGIGLTLGALFSVFLDRDDSENERFVALVGIITFASGAAFFLHLSVLLVNLILGMVLANTHQAGDRIRETLGTTRRPISLLLLVFAGAMWQPSPLIPTLAVSAIYLLIRPLGKALACWVSSLGTSLRGDLARGLLAQGDVAVAMALSFRLVYSGPAIDVAYTAILVGVVVNELIAPRLLKGLLVDVGEVRSEARTASGGA